MNIWNKRLNCWINKGSKGIALVNTETGRPKLKYVFDISDVHKARRIGRFPDLWEVTPEKEQAVIKHMEIGRAVRQYEKQAQKKFTNISKIILKMYQTGIIIIPKTLMQKKIQMEGVKRMKLEYRQEGDYLIGANLSWQTW